MVNQIFSIKYLMILTIILAISMGGSIYLGSGKYSQLPTEQQEQASLTKLNNTNKSADELIDNALQYSLDGNYHDSVTILIPLSEQGNLRAQLYLGTAYYHGHGVKRNAEKAKQIFFNLQSKNYETGIVNTYLNLINSLPVIQASN